MSPPPGPKMTWLPAQYRVRLELKKSDCKRRKPDPSLIERAKKKLQLEMRKGNISFYRFFETRLTKIWQSLFASDLPPDFTVGVTLATGAPPMPGIKLEAADGKDHIARLTIDADPKVVAKWSFHLFKLTIGKLLHEKKIKTIADGAHLHALFRHAASGFEIANEPVFPLPPIPEGGDEDYRVVADPSLGVVRVVVYKLDNLVDEFAIPSIVADVVTETKRLKTKTGKSYRFLKGHIQSTLESALRGPERMGMDLPLAFLGAVGDPEQRAKAKPKTAAQGQQGATFFELEISATKMSATISKFAFDKYSKAQQMDLMAWVKKLKDQGIKHGASDKHINELMAALKEKKDPVGMVVAEGTPPRSGDEPFLFATHKHKKFDGNSSIRDAQQRTLVTKGEVVAEIRYMKEPEFGCDVLGNEVKPAKGAVPTIKVCDGVETQDGGYTFVATKDGIPEVGENEISFQNALVWEGNVNLTSGNIYFDGPGKITGNIEAGSWVEVSGDLEIEGQIDGGYVRVGGNLTVTGGIVTPDSSLIKVKGSIDAEFIENSDIFAGGKITARKSILTSRLHSRDEIIVADDEGIVTGGTLIANNRITAQNVGRNGGMRTYLEVGSETLKHRSLEIKKKRLIRLEKILKEAKTAQRFAKSEQEKVRARRGKADVPTVDPEKIPRCKAAIERLEQQIEAVDVSIDPNPDAKILVDNILCKNTSMKVGGKKVGLKEDVAGVAILSERVNGSYIVNIDEVRAAEKSEKKAS